MLPFEVPYRTAGCFRSRSCDTPFSDRDGCWGGRGHDLCRARWNGYAGFSAKGRCGFVGRGRSA